MRKLLSLLPVAVIVFATAIAGQPAASAADSHALITGSGSTWSSNAVNQWIADVQANGLQVVFTGNGSASGRKDYSLGTTDFAVSDIGYQGKDPVTQDDDSSSRPYAYLPIVAGGTAFPYHLERAGQLVRNLRLSGLTLAKIFTNQITMWNDPAITKDNNGNTMPAIPIVPVVHSEGSGSSAQFTTYLNAEFPSIWGPFNGGHNTLNEYYPRQGNQIAQNGSDGVINYVTSSAANGTIAFDEYSYALAKNYPVVKLENAAGYYTLPTQYNVAVALTQAKINMDTTSPDYLLQDLSNVYTYNDPRTYALSSYSYMIIPTAATPADPTMTTAKRQTLADYLDYSICQGQKEMGPIGYSPLPINLVQASFDQIAKLKTADPGVDISQANVTACDNPTFIAGNPTDNHLADIAPQPPACDKDGAGPCAGAGDTGTAVVSAPSSTAPASGSTKTTAATTKSGAKGTTGTTGTGSTAGSTAGTGTGAGTTGTTSGTGTTGSDAVGSVIGGSTGGAVDSSGVTGGLSTAGSADASTQSGDGSDDQAVTTLAAPLLPLTPASADSTVLGPLVLLELLAVIVGPPLLIRALRRRPTRS
jgi:ABC-type phosphate transport system substrate-binding protein